VAKAKGAPVEEMQACAAACASWLLRNGFCTNPFDDGEGPTLPPPDASSRLLPHINEDGQEQARTVQALLSWLDWQVLPALDGRREGSRIRLEGSVPRGTVPDPKALAELLYGEEEERLAEKVRGILGSQAALRSEMEKVLARQIRRASLAHQPPPPALAQFYRRWLADGEGLLKVLLWPGPTGRRIPRTMRDWLKARALFEADLKQVGFSAAEIMGLLPGGGSKEALKARSRRSRKRAAR
jgi:hypothetical protein